MPDQIGAGDVAPDASGRVQPHAFLAVSLRGEHDFRGYGFVLDDFLFVVKIIDKQIQGVNALFESPLNHVPFTRGYRAGNDVEGENLLHARLFAIHIEGDAHL